MIGKLQNRAQPATKSLSREELEEAQRNRLVVGPRGPATEAKRRDLRIEIKRRKLASVDLEVYFAYDSATITPRAMHTLITLGQALTDGRLAGDRFLIAGHTDARGSREYNQRLSERRAEAVRRFLLETFDIPPRRLIAVGYGEEELKNPWDPEAAENRRVQIVNLGRAVAGR